MELETILAEIANGQPMTVRQHADAMKAAAEAGCLDSYVRAEYQRSRIQNTVDNPTERANSMYRWLAYSAVIADNRLGEVIDTILMRGTTGMPQLLSAEQSPTVKALADYIGIHGIHFAHLMLDESRSGQ